MSVGLSAVDHFVVLMLENRSFDHMLGFLYADSGNVSPAGHPFDGLTGQETNPGPDGKPVPVSKIDPSQKYAYFAPGADPGEGYYATNSQLFGTIDPKPGAQATMDGFVHDFAYTLAWQARERQRDPKSDWTMMPGTTPASIMDVFTPALLPVLSGLASGYAVCDRWFSSVPTQTLPNRYFALQATSQGYMDDKTRVCTAKSIFTLLDEHGADWAVYGYSKPPLTRDSVVDITHAPDARFGLFHDFQAAAAAGSLPAFTFLEPSWESTGNSQHPNYDVALGEQLIHDVYYAVRNGPKWERTLLVLTYDEHGGCYDHVPPPGGATPPDATHGEFEFDFTRFGPRVPTLLVSPYIPAGTVFRAPDGKPPFDHTSVLKSVETRFGLPPLTGRDAASADVSGALSLDAPRSDDPLADVTPPQSGVDEDPGAGEPTHLQQVHAELIAALPGRDGYHRPVAHFQSSAEAARYIAER